METDFETSFSGDNRQKRKNSQDVEVIRLFRLALLCTVLFYFQYISITLIICSLQIDNSKQVLKKIATLYAEKLMNDICLVVDGIEYPAHRLILCTSSEVFQVNFLSISSNYVSNK